MTAGSKLNAIICATLAALAVTDASGVKSADAAESLNPLTQLPYAQNVGSVYPGCETPPAPGSGAIYYSDPVSGSDKNDGSRAHPFASLHQMAVDGMFATDPFHSGRGVITAGATVYLLPGNHGDVTLQGWHGVSNRLDGLDFASWVTIAGEPGNPYGAVVSS
ncbi:MAG TPA: hypothetical protein VG501_11365, partial [Rhizomicrobium sp.]|nr:hypothetical protein [Rhizomicrobium sp.]